MTQRRGHFWDAVEGRAPMPTAATTLGWSLVHADIERGEVEVSFEATEDFLNPAGTVQGGFLTAMLDDTMGPALAATLDDGQYGTTIDLKVSFLRPAKPGRLTGHGRIVHRGGTIAFLAGELLDETGQVVAVGSATTRILRIG
jgi:uncharacterized protein (TIGR00369 family)